MATHVRNLYFWQRRGATAIAPNSAVLITGAGSGIGQQIAYIFARRGCRLVLCDMNASSLEETRKKCLSENPAAQCVTVQCDVTDYAQCRAAVEQSVRAFDGIDVLVLCAGIGAHHTFTGETDLTIFRKLMEVNFFGYLNVLHCAFSALSSSRGHVVAVTSFSGEVGLPYRTAYCASKFAATGLLESLRSEMTLRRRIEPHSAHFTITVVCPPTVNSNLRRNSLTPDPKLRDVVSADGLSVEECAAAIVDAADRKLRKAFFGWSNLFASYLRPILPDQMDQLINKRAKL